MLAKIFKKLKSIFFKSTFPPFIIENTSKISVGKMTFHNGNFVCKGDQNVSIGNFCAIGNGVSIVTSNHDYNFVSIQGSFYKKYFKRSHPGAVLTPPNLERTKGDVIIGSDVWVSDNVFILSGVKVGNGSCIAANSVVTKDVLPFSIVGGSPAKFIKFRFNEDVRLLLERIEWWNWSDEKIKENEDFFLCNLNNMTLSEINLKLKL